MRRSVPDRGMPSLMFLGSWIALGWDDHAVWAGGGLDFRVSDLGDYSGGLMLGWMYSSDDMDRWTVKTITHSAKVLDVLH